MQEIQPSFASSSFWRGQAEEEARLSEAQRKKCPKDGKKNPTSPPNEGSFGSLYGLCNRNHPYPRNLPNDLPTRAVLTSTETWRYLREEEPFYFKSARGVASQKSASKVGIFSRSEARATFNCSAPSLPSTGTCASAIASSTVALLAS